MTAVPEPPIAKSPEYTRAPGSFAWLGYFRGLLVQAENSRGQILYFADDHMMILTPNFEAAVVRRFRYDEVRGIRVQPDPRWIYINLVWMLSLIVALGAVILILNPETRLLGIVLSALYGGTGLGAILFNLWLGPTCNVTLYTRTAAEPLPALRRRRHAERSIAILRQRIEAAQGALPAEIPEVSPDAFRAADRPAPALALRRRFTGLASDSSGNTHLLFFGILLALSLFLSLEFVFFSPIKHVFDNVLLVAALLVGCLAVARQRSSTLPEGLKRYTLTAIFLQAAFFYFSVVVQAMQDMDQVFVTGQAPAATVPVDLTNPEESFSRGLQVVKILWAGLLAMFGLLFTLQYRIRHAAVARAWHAEQTRRAGEASASVEVNDGPES